MKRLILVSMLLGGLVHAQTLPEAAAVPARIDAERQRLQAERALVEQSHEAMQRDCWQRLAVNECLREVRRKRYAALDPLRAQELALNAQERDWRAQQRDERLRDKDSAQEHKP